MLIRPYYDSHSVLHILKYVENKLCDVKLAAYSIARVYSLCDANILVRAQV